MKSKVFNIVNSSLQFFDLSGHKVSFKIKTNDEYRSYLSGLSYLIYIIAGICYFTYYFIKFINRETYTVSSSTKILNPVPKINLKEQGMNMSLQLLYDNFTSANNLISDDVLDISFVKSNTSYANKNREPIDTIIPTVNCAKEFFPQITQEEFDSNLLSTAKCPVITSDILLQGEYNEVGDFHTISILIKVKNITKLLSIYRETKIWVRFIYLETMIDHSSYDEFMGKYLKMTTTLLDPYVINYNRIFVSNTEFKSDNNILITDYSYKKSASIDQILKIYETVDLSKKNPYDYDNMLIFFQILASSKVFIYERIYQKFTSLLADTTGVLTEGLILLAIFFDNYNQKQAYEKILLESMRFEGNEKFDITTFKNFVRKMQQNEKVDICSGSPNESKSGDILYIKKKNNIDNNRENYVIEKRNKSKLNVGNNFDNDMISNNMVELKGINNESENSSVKNNHRLAKSEENKRKKSCWCFIKKDQTQEIQKNSNYDIDSKIDEYLDILTYLKKVSELNLLKSIILGNNKDRIELFDLMSFPTLDKSAGISSINYSNEKIEKIYDTYKNIKEMAGNKEENADRNYNCIDINDSLMENYRLFLNSILNN